LAAGAPVATEPAAPTFQPISRLTPQPEPGSEGRSSLFTLGGFLIILIALMGGGVWALRRQS